ncbi:MAG: NusG domain II-containing protein [Treponema sp.]|nr:NusG domain II-containing protein [Treponema sp.]
MLKPFDFSVLVSAFCVAAGSFVFAYSGVVGDSAVHVKGEGGEWIFSRDAAETISVAGPLGDTLIEIQDGAARVLASPCANQTCIASGTIHSPGQWTACLPNRVMVFIGEESGRKPGSGGETGVDAAAW